MSISIVSDLVLDVVRAANPERARIAQANLQNGKPVASSKFQFANALTEAQPKESAGISELAANGVDPKKKAYQQFEAGVLRNFVEEMLPKSTDSLYGSGTAGNVWRSMQADFMSQELAKSGGVGIATTLARLDEKKSRNQQGNALNELPQQAPATGKAIIHTSEWPYFSRQGIGVLES
jgi:peptidoglycan hydrolase FlgJ